MLVTSLLSYSSFKTSYLNYCRRALICPAVYVIRCYKQSDAELIIAPLNISFHILYSAEAITALVPDIVQDVKVDSQWKR